MSSDETKLGTDGAADDYDLLPYPSMPYPRTQPARLAAVAALHGLDAPRADRARVLELGCASGGNIIPLAVRFPEARFVGVDLGRRHIEDARARVAALRLPNIEFQQADITTLPLKGEQFDYVICHGVFSWAPRATQDAIFHLCRDRLSNNGLAVISYNVLPGWHMRSVIRDICLRHVGTEGPPNQRVAKARAILNELAAASRGTEPYGLLLRNEAQRIAHRPASYLLGEFLVADNTPCYFSDFVARAGQSDLAYVCEADLETLAPQTLNTEMQQRLRANAGPDPLAIEQYGDYFTGRTFRTSLLAKAAGPRAKRDYERMRALNISAELRPDPAGGDSGPTYKDARNRTVQSADPAVARALAALSAAFPATLRFADIMTGPCQALSVMVATGQAEISSLPLRVGGPDQVRPRLWSCARVEAAVGQIWLTSLAHTAVPLKPAIAILAPYLDGTNDRARLGEVFAEALRRGQLDAPELKEAPANDESIQKLAAEYVERCIKHLAVNALLAPEEIAQ